MDSKQRLLAIFDQSTTDEQEVLLKVAEGLSLGRSVYGPLDVDADDRDWLQETLEELRDALVYSTAGLIRTMRRRKNDECRCPYCEGKK